ncbi:hypothetical protein [Paludisphaera soli]|uniref:hypothetical protein n=1 Tax=Paludisphaera soli TaxID=2712865 RepID=UPI0013ED767A|nr:hypothetical protein [Paludisphaera soli]
MNKSRLRLGLTSVAIASIYVLLLTRAEERPRDRPVADQPPARVEAPPPIANQTAPPTRSHPRNDGPPDVPEIVIPNEATPPPAFEVWTRNRRMKAAERCVFEQIREALADNRVIPEHRARHFSWIKTDESGMKTEDLGALNWTAELLAVEPIENGHLVSLRIQPRMGPPGGGQLVLLDHSIERYKVFQDGTWSFVDGTTPPGMGHGGWIMD